MKKISCWVILIAAGLMLLPGLVSVQAQDYLDDYSKVKRQVPQYIVQKIERLAEKKYPDNDRLKQYTLQLQKKAYFKVKDYQNNNLPSQELKLIMRNAERDYPYDYARQLLEITKKTKEYIDTHK